MIQIQKEEEERIKLKEEKRKAEEERRKIEEENQRLKEEERKKIEEENQRIKEEQRIRVEEEEKIRLAKELEEIARVLEIENKGRLTLLTDLQKEFHFDGFHHYTDFTNFINILDCGKLYSRYKTKEIDFLDAADKAVLGKTDRRVYKYVRFYYKEKTPTFYVNEGIKLEPDDRHMPLPVLLLFNEDILFHPNTWFLSGCGGSNSTTHTNTYRVAKENDWGTVFSRGKVNKEDKELSKYIKDKRHAEFLYWEEISVEHIKKIIFRSEADLKRAKLILGENKLFEVNKYKFNKENNYLDDYDVSLKNDNTLQVYFKFNLKRISMYKHRIEIVYQDGNIVNEKIGFNDIYSKSYIDGEIETVCMGEVNEGFIYNKKLDRSIKELRYYMNEILSMVWKSEEHS